MPRQTIAQKIGALGETIVQQQIQQSDNWIARKLNEDYGIDIELELSDSESVKGEFIKAQIKTHKKIDGNHSERLKKTFLRYVYECRVPIILIVVSLENQQAKFVWLQKWLIETDNIMSIYDDNESGLTVSFQNSSDLKCGLGNELITIANWQNRTQLFIAVKDLATLSLNLQDHKLSCFLMDYIGEYFSGGNYDPIYFSKLLDRVIEIGVSIWATPEGNELSKLLYTFIRTHGDKINSDHIFKFVTRGETISRTGLNALGILYDHYPTYIKSLRLPEKFQTFEDPRLHFYCVFREQNLGKSDFDLYTNVDNIIKIGKLAANLTDVDVLNKWANRGESFLLDYIYPIEYC